MDSFRIFRVVLLFSYQVSWLPIHPFLSVFISWYVQSMLTVSVCVSDIYTITHRMTCQHFFSFFVKNNQISDKTEKEGVEPSRRANDLHP